MEVQELSNGRPTIVFYPRRGGVLVTDTWFCANGHRFAVDDLVRLHWRWGSMPHARRVVLVAALIGAVLVAAGVAATDGAQVAVLAAVGYVPVAATAVLVSFRHWPTPLHLWAVYHDTLTIVYTSTDHTTFHQVLRALVRAGELREPVR